jgi:hypothetical protein
MNLTLVEEARTLRTYHSNLISKIVWLSNE